MMYKDTFKLLLSNFHLVWKILAYVFISTLCVIGLAYACSLPILKVLEAEGVVGQFTSLFVDFSKSFNIYELLSNAVSLIENFFNVIANNIANLWLYIVLFLFIIIVIRAFLGGFYKFAATNVLYYYLSSNIKFSFTSSLLSYFKMNLKYQLASLVVQLPIDVLFVAVFYYALKWLVTSEGLLLLAPICIIILAILLLSVKITFFSGWLPAMVVFDCGVWEGLKKGVKAVFRRFYRSFSTAVLIMFTLIVLNVVCAVCTFGASIIVTIPLNFLVVLIYNMVVFYSSQGMRYYVDTEHVVTPKKLEETDGIGSLKFLI